VNTASAERSFSNLLRVAKVSTYRRLTGLALNIHRDILSTPTIRIDEFASLYAVHWFRATNYIVRVGNACITSSQSHAIYVVICRVTIFAVILRFKLQLSTSIINIALTDFILNKAYKYIFDSKVWFNYTYTICEWIAKNCQLQGASPMFPWWGPIIAPKTVSAHAQNSMSYGKLTQTRI